MKIARTTTRLFRSPAPQIAVLRSHRHRRSHRRGPESTDRRLEDERDARNEWSDDRPRGSARRDAGEERVEDRSDRGLDDAGRCPDDSGRRVDEPESDLSDSDGDDHGTDDERSTGEPSPDAERMEEVPIELEQGGVGGDPTTDDRSAVGPADEDRLHDERRDDERPEAERTVDDRTMEDRPDEDERTVDEETPDEEERTVDEETPDESSGLLSRFLRR